MAIAACRTMASGLVGNDGSGRWGVVIDEEEGGGGGGVERPFVEKKNEREHYDGVEDHFSSDRSMAALAHHILSPVFPFIVEGEPFFFPSSLIRPTAYHTPFRRPC